MTILGDILGSDCCSGCGACAYLAPDHVHMEYSAAGFLRPVETMPLTPEEDQRISVACPGISLDLESEALVDDRLWGPIVAARTGHAAVADLRHQASSGGVISAVLIHLLESKQVDCVIQTSASLESPARNQIVLSRTAADVRAAAGSRYAPSAPLESLKYYLAQPGRFAFVGKPCDVAALRALTKDDAALAARIPYMISFFCAGVPSTRGADNILRELGVEPGALRSFRYRGDGWPGFATAETADGQKRAMSYEASWGNILSKHVQFRCKICPDGSGGFADIVCGDAWESDARGYPKFAESEGRSLILTRTAAGEKLCNDARRAGGIFTEDLGIDRIETMQPSQARRKRLVLSRLWAMRLANRKVPRFRGLQLATAARSAGPLANIKSFLGLCRRLAMGRA